MNDSTGKPIYQPQLDANETVRSINTFVFEATIAIIKSVSLGAPLYLSDCRLMLDNQESTKTYTVSLSVEEKLTIIR